MGKNACGSLPSSSCSIHCEDNSTSKRHRYLHKSNLTSSDNTFETGIQPGKLIFLFIIPWIDEKLTQLPGSYLTVLATQQTLFSGSVQGTNPAATCTVLVASGHLDFPLSLAIDCALPSHALSENLTSLPLWRSHHTTARGSFPKV